MRLALVLCGGLLAVLALLVAAVAIGSTPLPVRAVIDALAGGDGPTARIVVDLRLPRALLALLVGAGLGTVGCLLQTTTRNDLADPFLFGLSSGAAAGAVLVITVTGDLLGLWTLPLAAFAGGMAASSIVLALIARLGDRGPARLVLAGLAVSFLFMALTNYLVFAGDQRAAVALRAQLRHPLDVLALVRIPPGGQALLARHHVARRPAAEHRHLRRARGRRAQQDREEPGGRPAGGRLFLDHHWFTVTFTLS